MFGLGTTELVLIMVALVLLFGARRLPELGRGLGKGMRDFRDSLKGIGPDAAGESDSVVVKAADAEAKT